MLDELPRRETWREVMTVALSDTNDLPIVVRSRYWRTTPCADLLAVSTALPGWSRRWSAVIPDDFARETLSTFLHYARQYIHRSHVAKVLMIIWEKHQRVLHPFGDSIMYQFYEVDGVPPSLTKILDAAGDGARERWGPNTSPILTRSKWTLRNTLDPHIQQAIFHFLRGQSLLAHGFELEAVVAFDCMLQSLKRLLMRAGLLTSQASRGAVCEALGIGSTLTGVADRGYFVRNNFGAHAGGWRWWDYGELLENLIPSLPQLAGRVLAKAATIEPQIRSIEPDPQSWYEWLLKNLPMLWDVVFAD
jgi:hypothetical protein